ncbi:hypothetical protein ACFE04_018712 [Oxalis oulophora]
MDKNGGPGAKGMIFNLLSIRGEIVETYTKELRKLNSRIMELTSEGLYRGNEFFERAGGLSESPIMLKNQFPPCPDSSLTFRIVKQHDMLMDCKFWKTVNGFPLTLFLTLLSSTTAMY